jgi:hypothetical protein
MAAFYAERARAGTGLCADLFGEQGLERGGPESDWGEQAPEPGGAGAVGSRAHRENRF